MKKHELTGKYGWQTLCEVNSRIRVIFKNYIKSLLADDPEDKELKDFYPHIGCMRVYKLSFRQKGLLAKETKYFDKNTRLSLGIYASAMETKIVAEAHVQVFHDEMFDMEIVPEIKPNKYSTSAMTTNEITFHINIRSKEAGIENVMGKKEMPEHHLFDVNGQPIKTGDRILYHKYSLKISKLKDFDEKHMIMENGDTIKIYYDNCRDVLVVNNKRISIK